MQPSSQARAAILRRLAQLESELRHARTELRNLPIHDPATAAVVIRGAKLSRERSALERQLELLRQKSAERESHPV